MKSQSTTQKRESNQPASSMAGKNGISMAPPSQMKPVQKQEEEEEAAQGKNIQLQEEEEELAQGKNIQMQEEEEEAAQGKM